MDLLFTVHPDSGNPYEVTAKSREILAWERGRPGRKYSALVAAMAGRGDYEYGDLYALAHAAAVRAGLFGGTLQDFEQSVVVEGGHQLTGSNDDDGEADDSERPTSPAP